MKGRIKAEHGWKSKEVATAAEPKVITTRE